jgi:hypothetical protein
MSRSLKFMILLVAACITLFVTPSEARHREKTYTKGIVVSVRTEQRSYAEMELPTGPASFPLTTYVFEIDAFDSIYLVTCGLEPGACKPEWKPQDEIEFRIEKDHLVAKRRNRKRDGADDNEGGSSVSESHVNIVPWKLRLSIFPSMRITPALRYPGRRAATMPALDLPQLLFT